MSQLPKVGCNIKELAQYLLDTGVNEKSVDDAGNKKLPKFARRYSFPEQDLIDALFKADGQIPLQDRFEGLTPNLSYGPLSYEQKVFIRDHLQHETASLISQWVKSSISNVKLAKQGQFKEPPKQYDTTRPYGPLTYAEQCYIRDNCKEMPTGDLAKQYNTHYNNIYRAQRGEFPTPHALRKPENKRPFGPLTIDEKREIRDHRSQEPTAELAKEYNTNYNNVKHAQEGRFKDTGPKTPSVYEQHKKLLAGLMGHGYTICLDGNSSTPIEEIIKEILA